MDEKKILISRTDDLFSMCEKYAKARFSPFLDGGELAYLEDNYIIRAGFNVKLFGGARGCERKIMGVFPEWEEPSEESFPIKAVRFTGRQPMEHRACLGTVMALGIERGKTGDIFTEGNTACIFAYNDIAQYIGASVSRIGSQGVKAEVVPAAGIELPEPKLTEIRAVCASDRLDAVVAAAAGASRSAAAALIRSGKVKLNHRETQELSKTVKSGDLISLRGFGRYLFEDTGERTRSGRAHIKLYKYM